jgi:hypothetical protein
MATRLGAGGATGRLARLERAGNPSTSARSMPLRLVPNTRTPLSTRPVGVISIIDHQVPDHLRSTSFGARVASKTAMAFDPARPTPSPAAPDEPAATRTSADRQINRSSMKGASRGACIVPRADEDRAGVLVAGRQD